jgi:hypothetical protein
MSLSEILVRNVYDLYANQITASKIVAPLINAAYLFSNIRGGPITVADGAIIPINGNPIGNSIGNGTGDFGVPVGEFFPFFTGVYDVEWTVNVVSGTVTGDPLFKLALSSDLGVTFVEIEESGFGNVTIASLTEVVGSFILHLNGTAPGTAPVQLLAIKNTSGGPIIIGNAAAGNDVTIKIVQIA